MRNISHPYVALHCVSFHLVMQQGLQCPVDNTGKQPFANACFVEAPQKIVDKHRRKK
jgi:hypothetical protein